MLQLNQPHIVRTVQPVAVRTDKYIIKRTILTTFEAIRTIGLRKDLWGFCFDQGLAWHFSLALNITPLNRHIAQPRHIGINFIKAPGFTNLVHLLVQRIVQHK